MVIDTWMVMVRIPINGLMSKEKDFGLNGILRPNKVLRISLVNKQMIWNQKMEISLKETSMITSKMVIILSGNSVCRLCLKKTGQTTNGTFLMSQKYGHIQTIL